jgi:hypothetical protein
MNNITDKTTIDELTKIHIPKCYEKYVNKAIACSTKLLTMREFVEETEFNIHPETFDILFTNINDEGIPIYIDASMLEWMGYNGTAPKRKQLIKELLERNFEEDIDYKILKNNAYADFLEEEKEKIKDTVLSIFNSNLPNPETGESARSVKHLVVMPDAFRHLCMMINTDKGKQIRKYYTTLEKLIKAYNLYQTIFRGQQAERAMSCKGNKIDQLLLEMKKMNQAADEEYKKAAMRYKNLMSRHDTLEDDYEEIDNKLGAVIKHTSTNTGSNACEYEDIFIYKFANSNPSYSFEAKYIVFKGQRNSKESSLARHKEKITTRRASHLHRDLTPDEIPVLTEVKVIGYTGSIPNAKKVWRRFKRENRRNIKFISNSTTLFNMLRISEEEFIQKLCTLDIDHREENAE